MNTHSSLDRFFKITVGSLSLVVLLWAIYKVAQSLMGIVTLFGLVLMMTYILLAPVNLMEDLLDRLIRMVSHWLPSWFRHINEEHRVARTLAILLVYLMFALSALVISVRFVPVAASQLLDFTNNLPAHVQQVEEWVLNQPVMRTYFHQEVEALRKKGNLSSDEQHRIHEEFAPQEKSGLLRSGLPLSVTEKRVIREKVFSTTEHLNHFMQGNLTRSFNSLIALLSNTLTGLVYTLTGLVLMFYFLKDGADLKEGLLDILPGDLQGPANHFLCRLHQVMFGFVKGQVMLGIATGIYMMILYSVFNVPYALFLGAWFIIAEILPVVGTWIGFTPGILVMLLTSPVTMIMVMGLCYVYQVIKDNVVAPRVLGQTTGLHPVIVILSLLLCAKVAGIVGVLFAIPLASALNVLVEMSQEREEKRFEIS